MSQLEDNIESQLKQIPGVAVAYLFGSHASGTANIRSDVDIAILFQREACPDKLALLQLKSDLADALHSEVDLICLNTASPIMGMQVLKNGKEIVVHDSRTRDRFVMTLFTDYFDLKRIRKPMEDTILQRKLYG